MKLLFYDFEIPYLLKDANYPIGGACVRQVILAKELVKLSNEVGILTWEGANKYVGQKAEFDLIESYNPDKGIRKLRLFYLRYPALLNAVARYKPDFLFQKTAAIETGILSLIGKILGIPFIYLVANDFECDERLNKKLSLLDRIAFKYGISKAKMIVCQNTFQLNKLKLKYPGHNFMLMHNPFLSSSPLPRIKSQSERRYIAWVGNFQNSKNLPALLKVVLSQPDMKFKIAGKLKLSSSDGSTLTAIEKLESCSNVEFVGYLSRKEILNFLNSAYALLNTSHYEGFSNTFLESLAAGTPIITRTNIDPDHIIQRNNLGIVVTDYDELPRAVEEIRDTGDYDDIASRCREYVLSNHDSGVLVSKFHNEILKLAN